jgi:hypothetical protein
MIYAIRESSKVSMDIKNFKKHNNQLQLQMDNLRVHSAPMYLSVFDYRVLRFIRILMKHGMTLEFASLPDKTVSVKWKIQDAAVNKTLQEGKLYLSKFHQMAEEL